MTDFKRYDCSGTMCPVENPTPDTAPWIRLEDAQRVIDQLVHERDLLGNCIGEIVVAAGHISPGFSLSGPQLLQFGTELRDSLLADQDERP